MLQLVQRDHEIIKFLRDQGWALAPQIAEKFFPSARACANRMKQLEQAGMVEAHSMSKFRSNYWNDQVILNVVCGIHGKTKIYRLGEHVRSSLGSRWERTSAEEMLTHQVLLGSVRNSLEKTLPGSKFVYDNTESLKHIGKKSTSDSSAILPDLVCHSGSIKIAVELERKARRGLGRLNTAYEDRFDKLTMEYDLVLYVVEDGDIIKPLLKKADGRSKIGVSSILKPQEIYRLDREPIDVTEFIEEHRRVA